jgi:hypothetical protein
MDTKPLRLDVPADLHRRLKLAVTEDDDKMHLFIRRAIETALDERSARRTATPDASASPRAEAEE